MKQIFRASLVAVSLLGIYAGLSTPAPAMTSPTSAVTMSDSTGTGTAPVPTYPTSPTSPSNPKTN